MLRGMFRCAVIAAALCAVVAPARANPAERATPIEAEYVVVQSGIAVMEIRITAELTGDRYRIVTRSRSAGLGRLFLPREQVAEAHGGLAGREVLPLLYRSEGDWRGTSRRILMEFVGRTPRLAVMDPPEGPDRIPVPPEATTGTIDTLSALVRLARVAGATGRCDLTGSVFDGRRRLEWSSRTVGTERSPLPAFGGEALRCALESRLVAGFRRSDDPAEAGRPRQAQAWLATLGPGQPPLPLRVEFPSTLVGAARLDLVRAGSSARR